MATTLRGEVRDQIVHMAAAAIILAPAMLHPSILTFAWAGFWIGTVREVTELETPFTIDKLWRSILNSKLDLTFWTIGAALTAFFIGA